MSELKELYRERFSESDRAAKKKMWQPICRYISKFTLQNPRVVVDVAAGYCDFINNFESKNSGIIRYAVDANPDVAQSAGEGVNVCVGDALSMDETFKSNTVSLFFMSNFLEHVPKAVISKLLRMEYDLLEDNGEVCILTPNIRYVGGKYWDYFDHITPLTEKAIIEEAQSAGYFVKSCVAKTLPYTVKSRLPKAPWLVSLYLSLMPLSGMIFGKQSLIVLQKRGGGGILSLLLVHSKSRQNTRLAIAA